MTWSPGPVVTRHRLGGELKRLRDAAGLKLEDVARRLECSPSKISRLENGKGIPRTRDVRDMLAVYGVPEGPERERLLEWSRTGRAPMWWSEYADVLPSGMATYLELEWDASTIHAFESHIVHGLLQTREYARAVLQNAYGGSRSSAEIERLVEVRMRRQEALTSDHGLTFVCVLDESTLYRVVGSPAILRGQLDHLIGMAGAEHVDVRVLPFSAGLIATNLGPFSKIDFTTGIEQGLVFLERPGTNEFVVDRTEVSLHDERMAAVLAASLTERESVPLIERAVQRVSTA
jgi:transcriptional regulator with XRE-family HTH domain